MRVWLPVPALVMLAGCGFPGEPMPPALNRPARVMDLAVLERGDKIFATFMMPVRTTEDLPIRTPSEIEMRVGPIGDRFVQDEWEQSSDRVAPDLIQVAEGRVEAQIPAAKYYGKTVVIGVRVRGPKGRDVGWSVDVINVLPALPTPEALTAQDASGGVKLEWRVAREAAEFRVFRRVQGEKEWGLAGLSDSPSYLDTGIEYGKAYEYFVQSGEKTGAKYAESELSATVVIKPVDRFAPATPAGLTAVPGTKSIELVWDRSAEADFAFYRLYRDNLRLADAVQSPSYSDKDVVAGAKHTYQVTAVDTAGNESARSVPVDATLP